MESFLAGGKIMPSACKTFQKENSYKIYPERCIIVINLVALCPSGIESRLFCSSSTSPSNIGWVRLRWFHQLVHPLQSICMAVIQCFVSGCRKHSVEGEVKSGACQNDPQIAMTNRSFERLQAGQIEIDQPWPIASVTSHQGVGIVGC